MITNFIINDLVINNFIVINDSINDFIHCNSIFIKYILYFNQCKISFSVNLTNYIHFY
jgi:hypothetical protein